MRNAVQIDGVSRGRVPEGLPVPPPPLPYVPTPRMPRGQQCGSTGMTVKAVINLMATTFTKEVGYRRARRLHLKMDEEWWASLVLLAGELLDEGIAPDAYVSFVCESIRKHRRREPFAGEVFSLLTMRSRATQVWLQMYRKNSVSYLQLPTYTATPARRRKHMERIQACRLPPPPAPTT